METLNLCRSAVHVPETMHVIPIDLSVGDKIIVTPWKEWRSSGGNPTIVYTNSCDV